MSWINIFKKARQNDTFDPAELDLIEAAARTEVDELFDRGPSETPTTPSSNGNGPAYTRRVAIRETLAQSTSRADIMALRDWKTIDDASNETGLKVGTIKGYIEGGAIDAVHYEKCPPLVNVRQIAYYRANRQRLDVDMTVFDGWKRQSDLAVEYGIPDYKLSGMVRDREIAAYKPHMRLVLLNADEVLRVLASQ